MPNIVPASVPVGDYWWSRSVTLVDDLAQLRGPASGIVRLPVMLDWTPRGDYDLSDEEDQRALYEVALRECHDESELGQHLNEALLRQLWGALHLPPPVREAWETPHPSLIG